LTIETPKSILNYSKAPRGLFVLVEVGRVFTAIAISPSEGLRQLSARYAFRAGRNLPDKELRYRRTVIVTAAVYRSLSSVRIAHSHQLPISNPLVVGWLLVVESCVLCTPPLNLPALGRRQPVYFGLRLCTDLCFW